MMMGHYERAIEDFYNAIVLIRDIELLIRSEYWKWPRRKLFHYERGCAYLELEEYEDAIEDFNKAIRMDSNYLEAYLKSAYANFMIGNLAIAKKDLEKAESIKREE